MKKIIPSILIVIIVLQLFAPFSVGLNNKKIEVNKNVTEAVSGGAIKLKGTITNTDTTITVYAVANFETDNLRTSGERVIVVISDSNKKIIGFTKADGSVTNATVMEIHNINDGDAVLPADIKSDLVEDQTETVYYKKVFTGLNPSTTYYATIYATHSVQSWWSIAALVGGTAAGAGLIAISFGAATPFVLSAGVAIGGGTIVAAQQFNVSNDENTTIMDPALLPVTTNPLGQTTNTTAYSSVSAINEDAMLQGLECKIMEASTWGGCVGQVLYWGIFKPTSVIFGLTGELLDFTVGYSVKDTSYRSNFVVEGWGIIRDFCNMFFIFVLLYIAFGTILNLNGVKTKEMIISVVIIGLLMNFSLFAVRVIIDTSNILTRVFYNSESIAVGPKVDGVIQNELGYDGSIKLSEALVSKINPQKLIINAAKVEKIQTRNTVNSTTPAAVTAGTFILVTILASVINIIGLITFLTCAVLFIVRVVGLWLAMIFAPLAFFSYTVPAMQDIETVGWKHWWRETLKLAFMAPIFMFFMYIIIKFLDTGLNLVVNDDASGMEFLLGIFIPFLFIMILLIKAKDVTKTMSGKLGEMAVKAASSVGGLALGAATGGALSLGAGALRGTVGALGNKLATSKFASTNGAIGRGFGNIGKWAGGSSFDVRATKLGSSAISKTGVDMGKAKEGGYKKHLEEKVEKRQKRAKELEVHESEPLKQALNAVEKDLQDLLRKNSHELETLDKQIKAARENSVDASAASKADPTDLVKKAKAKEASDTLAEFKEHKKAIRTGTTFTETALTAAPGTAARGVIDYTGNTINGRTINQLDFEDIPHAHAAIETENRNRKWAYAEAKSKWGGRGEKEAAHKIRMDAKLTDSGEKSH